VQGPSHTASFASRSCVTVATGVKDRENAHLKTRRRQAVERADASIGSLVLALGSQQS